MSSPSRALPGEAGSVPPRDLQQRFASLFSNVPASMRKLVKGESSVVGGYESSTYNSYLVVLEDVEDLCCGHIGTSGKICTKPASLCDVAKHGRSRCDNLKPGIYIRGLNLDEVLSAPYIALSRISTLQKEGIMKQKFESMDDAKLSLEQYTVEEVDEASQTSHSSNRKVPADFNSPVAKRAKKIDLNEKFLECVQVGSNLETTQDKEEIKRRRAIKDQLLKAMVSAIIDNQEDVESLLEKIVEVNGQIGVAPAAGPPALWMGFLDLKSDVGQLQRELAAKASASLSDKFIGLDNRVVHLDRLMGSMQHETREALLEMAKEIGSNDGSGHAPMDQGYGAQSFEDATSPMANLMDRVDTLTDLCNSLTRSSKPTSSSVKIGRYCFENIEELNGWCEKCLPPEFPFGAFVDIYSFLQRIKSFRDRADIDSLKSMDYRDRLDLTSDEAITLDAFSHPLPKGFRGTASEEGQMAVWLPGIKTPEKWADANETMGIKVMIKENIEVVRTRVLACVAHRLSKHPEAATLARELLANTITFLTELSEFISSTFRTLRSAGFSRVNAWNLVSKLVHRMLAVDCALKRGISFELLDAKEHKALAVSVLWGTFGTHQVIRTYQEHGIENHPSMASEYVRFLVAHTDSNRVEAMQSKVTHLEAEIKRLDKALSAAEKAAVQAQKAATSASNKVQELERRRNTSN